MRRNHLITAVVLGAALGVAACSQTAEQREDQQEAALATRGQATGDEITVTGCLTGSPERDAFVVTADRSSLTSGALYSRDGEVPTYTYELVGNASDLSQHVGQKVEVHGRVDNSTDTEVDVDKEEQTRLEPRQSGDEKVTPAIETDTEAEINVRRLEVSTITPTGQPCSAQGQ